MGLSFREKFAAAVHRNGSRLCVGLDPEPARIPGGDIARFNRAIIAATAELVCCYKPNIAFYEAQGRAGYDALRETLAAIPPDVPVLLDAKRGDVGNTADAYAKAVFDVLGVDAVTVNPYLGEDSLEPFLRRADRGVFILCRTSNPGSGDLQDLAVVGEDGAREPLYMTVASRANRWNSRANVGLVVGATYPSELAAVRSRCPDLPILIPGVGNQGGALQESAAAADNGRADGFLISVSRAVLYVAGPHEDLVSAARSAALAWRDQINAALVVGSER